MLCTLWLAEPYTCTGNFEVDFTELCRRGGIQQAEIPPVVLRPKRPGTPPPPDPKSKEPPPEETEENEDDPTPKTYVTKEKFDYFKPRVQVEMEKEDKTETVTEIFIRGKLRSYTQDVCNQGEVWLPQALGKGWDGERKQDGDCYRDIHKR